MSRPLNSFAILRILDALNIRRQAALLGLPYEATNETASSAPRMPQNAQRTLSYTRQLTGPTSAEKECNDLVEMAIAGAVELHSVKSNQGSSTEDSTRALQPRPTHDEHAGVSLIPANAGSPPSSEGRRTVGNVPTPRAEVGSTLEGRRLQGLTFDGLRFTGSFNRSDLSECFFRKSYVAHSTFNLARLNRADFSGAQLHSCTFMSAEARHVVGVNARFSHCHFRQCDLRNWDVRGATFFQCSFTLSDLSGWAYDGQTTLIEPVDWSRCRRLAWHVRSDLPVGDCRVVGKGVEYALSLPPATKPGRRSHRKKR